MVIDTLSILGLFLKFLFMDPFLGGIFLLVYFCFVLWINRR